MLHLNLLHLYMPGWTLFGLCGGGGGTLALMRMSLMFFGLLKATIYYVSSYNKTGSVQMLTNDYLSPLPWKRLYLEVWVQQFHKSHVLNELQLIQNMMLVNSKLPKTFEIFTQMSDFVFFPMVPPLHICWNTDGRLIESSVLFYTILPCFTM